MSPASSAVTPTTGSPGWPGTARRSGARTTTAGAGSQYEADTIVRHSVGCHCLLTGWTTPNPHSVPSPTQPDHTATAAGAAIRYNGHRGSWRLTGHPRGARPSRPAHRAATGRCRMLRHRRAPGVPLQEPLVDGGGSAERGQGPGAGDDAAVVIGEGAWFLGECGPFSGMLDPMVLDLLAGLWPRAVHGVECYGAARFLL
jgi:hypothetical protein